jgi:zinc transporter ZupT
MIGILLHKGAEAFGMGVLFIKGNTPRRQWIFLILLFATVLPVGIIIGLALSQTGDSKDFVYAVTNGFAAGSFMYITLLGVIVEEFSGFNNLWSKFIVMICGIIGMGTVVIVTDMYAD